MKPKDRPAPRIGYRQAVADSLWRFDPAGLTQDREFAPREYDALISAVLGLLNAGKDDLVIAGWLDHELVNHWGIRVLPAQLSAAVADLRNSFEGLSAGSAARQLAELFVRDWQNRDRDRAYRMSPEQAPINEALESVGALIYTCEDGGAALEFFDELLSIAPPAMRGGIGEGIMQDWLDVGGDRPCAEIAKRAQTDESWRVALRCVELDEHRWPEECLELLRTFTNPVR